MTPADNILLDQKAQRGELRKVSGSYPFKLCAEMMAEQPTKRWLIKGILAKGETSAWIAAPGGMKSALLAQAAICVAGGMDWHGKRSKEAAGVVYFALERADLVERRIKAHLLKLGLPSLPIVVVPVTVDLIKPDSIKRLVATVKDASDVMGTTVGFVVFDTFAKLIAAGGGDENQAKDQGAVFANLQRIKNHLDVHIAIIGHTGKDEARGARGSNAFLGDVDVMVTISGDQIKTAEITKANDAPEGVLFSFASEIHDFGVDEDGDPITVNVVGSETVQRQANDKPKEAKLTPNQRTMFGMLHAAGASGILMEDWNQQAKEVGIGIKRKADLTDIRNALLSKGLVREYSGRWTVKHD